MEGFITNVSVAIGLPTMIVFLITIVACVLQRSVDYADFKMLWLFGIPSIIALCWWLR